jgi:hypothetical protein
MKTKTRIKRQENVLLIEVDNKFLFTHKKNLPELVEFSRAFGAEISLVKPETPASVKILNLDQLAKKICDPTPEEKPPNYAVIEKKLSPVVKAKSHQITHFMQNSLLNGEAIHIPTITEIFPYVSHATVYNCFKKLCSKLSKDNRKVLKIKSGTYQISE